MNSRTKKIIIAVTLIAGMCALFFLGVIGGAAVLGWRAATHAGNEAATIQNLKTIAAVEVQYFNTHNRTYGAFDQLMREQFLSTKFAGHPAVADGYVVDLLVSQKPDGASSYRITADPQDDSKGTNHFYLDSDDPTVRFNSQRRASRADPVQ